jgi:hypothetical protein
VVVTTDNIVYLPAGCCPSAFDDSLLEVFLQIVILSSMPIDLEIAKEEELHITWAQALSSMEVGMSSFEA